MKRILAFALVAALAQASTALAGETLLSSGARHVQQVAVSEAPAVALSSASTITAKKPAASLQEQSGTLSRSSMSKTKKILIFVGIGVGVAASWYAIDQSVVDVTPSSQGKRQD